GRIGLVEDRWLVYAKVGGGWVHSSALLNFPGASWSGSNTSSGWLVGAGLEYGFKSHWTVRLEYDFLSLANWSSSTVPSLQLNRDVQMVKAGINYKFDAGLPEPVARVRPADSSARPGGEEDLAKQSQNPIADLVSVPFQSNTNFNTGPFNRTQEVLNIQPVVPMHINEDWNMISRTIVPVISQPDPILDSSTNGIGDITQSLFLSPAHSGAFGLHHSIGNRSHSRTGKGAARSNNRLADDAWPLGDRSAGQQSVVSRRRSVATARECVSCAAVHQLQPRARLVPHDITHHHRELVGRSGSAVDRAPRWRFWPCIQTRRPTSQCVDQCLLQC